MTSVADIKSFECVVTDSYTGVFVEIISIAHCKIVLGLMIITIYQICFYIRQINESPNQCVHGSNKNEKEGETEKRHGKLAHARN